MHSANSRTPLKAVGTLGGLALAGALLLTACGGGSGTASSVAASSAPSAASSQAFEPPRPTGISDDDWAMILGSFDPDAYREKLLSKTPEELAASCERPAMTDEDAQASAESGVAQYPDSTVDEWLALYAYVLPSMQAVKDEVCASAPAVESAPDAGAVTTIPFDPPRPTGVPDSDWAAYLATWDPNDWQAQVNDWDKDMMVDFCAMDEASVRDDVIGGLPEQGAQQYPESTIEEWTAFYDYAFVPYEAVRQDACAKL